jgi:uncharacterized membrane protein YeaQ/YmgE (transglycosylase-associated protein family)
MPSLKPLNLARVAHATTAWGVIFAIAHLYWAAGGEAGANGAPADTPAAQAYIAAIAALGLVGAVVAHGLLHRWGHRVGRQMLAVTARAGGAALLLGVAVGTGRWLADGSLNGDGVAGIVTTLYFLLGGALFSALGWRSTERAASPLRVA